MDKLIIDCETGEATMVALSPEEEAARVAEIQAAADAAAVLAALKAEQEAAKATVADVAASIEDKLAALALLVGAS
jgi:hypothetical protein